jgi:anti-sigma factor (TIGR02949 family)
MEEHNCRQLLGVLSDYVDGDLAAELCADLEHHLQTCPNCSVVVNTLRKTIELYQETTESDPLPQEVRQRLYARLDLGEYCK